MKYDVKSLFPKLSKEKIKSNIDKHWDFTRGLPIPKFQLKCPICESKEIMGRQWRFHSRNVTGSNQPCRCDVSFKCTGCSYVWVHGVVVPKDMFDKHHQGFIFWREAKEIIEKHS